MDAICKMSKEKTTWPCSARGCPLFADCLLEYQRKIATCPHCGGKLRTESIGWKCEKCQGFIDMQGNFHEHVEKPFMPPMTNGDRIRAMSDEELGELLRDAYAAGCDDAEKWYLGGSRQSSFIWDEEWLKQPAGEV